MQQSILLATAIKCTAHQFIRSKLPIFPAYSYAVLFHIQG